MSDKIKFSERVREDLILLNVEGETREEIFKQVAELFVEKGIAKDTYYQGLLDREAEFPTGLPIGDYNIAIPHTYPEHYNDIGICICVPKKPIKFFDMGAKEHELEVHVVVALALKKLDDSIKMLPSLMSFFADEDNIKAMMACKEPSEIMEMIAGH